MRYLSVCSGIEAATVAWHPLGWSPAAFAEIEAFPSAVLAHHYPHVPNLGDITRFKDWPDADVDVLVGGTPCQSFSVAGLRAGLADPRGNLALVYLAIADRYRPEWLVWENVPGVLSSGDGRDFGSIIGGMVELGYSPSWRVLDAQYVRVDGFARAVPQRRRRVFVVGHLGDWRRSAAVLFERESLQGNTAPRRQAGQGAAPTISARPTGGGGLGTDFDLDGGLIAGAFNNTGHGWWNETEIAAGLRTPDGGGSSEATVIASVARCLNAGAQGRIDGESETFVAHALRADGFDASEDGTGRGTPLVPIGFSHFRSTPSADEGISPTLGVSKDGGANGAAVAFDLVQITSKATRSTPQPVSPTMAKQSALHAIAFGGQMSTPHWQHDLSDTLQAKNPKAVQMGWAVRRLTPRECERLQGFPDDYTAIPYRRKQAADGPRYKALGNSMAVNAMRWLGTRIQIVSDILAEAA